MINSNGSALTVKKIDSWMPLLGTIFVLLSPLANGANKDVPGAHFLSDCDVAMTASSRVRVGRSVIDVWANDGLNDLNAFNFNTRGFESGINNRASFVDSLKRSLAESPDGLLIVNGPTALSGLQSSNTVVMGSFQGFVHLQNEGKFLVTQEPNGDFQGILVGGRIVYLSSKFERVLLVAPGTIVSIEQSSGMQIAKPMDLAMALDVKLSGIPMRLHSVLNSKQDKYGQQAVIFEVDGRMLSVPTSMFIQSFAVGKNGPQVRGSY